MTIRTCAGGLALLLAVLAAPVAAEPASVNASSCDRVCLIGFMEQYLDALAANDPSRLSKAVRLRFTEDGQELELGDGLWGTATARGVYRHYMADPESGTIAFFGTMRENGKPIFLVARLRIVDRKIADIETIVPRDQTPMAQAGIARLEAMQRPEALWEEEVPVGERMSRADLIRTANRYFTGLEANRPNGDYTFFAADCDRLENGTETTNRKAAPAAPGGGSLPPASEAARNMALGCEAQFSRGYFQMVTRVRDRRFLVVDRQKGVVFAFVFFDHAGQKREETLADGRTIPINTRQPFTWELGEAFKITGGKIRRVEALMKRAPYGMASGWDTAGLGYDPRTGPR
jgi:hypothetical protein